MLADPLRVYGLVGETMALLWVQNKMHTWPQATAVGHTPSAVRGASLRISGLRPGRWAIERWDTHKGEVAGTEQATVGREGSVSIALPDITWDAAFRLRWEAAAE